MEIIFILLILAIIYGVQWELKKFNRSAEIFIPWVFLLTFLSFIFVLPEARDDSVLPILENGIKPVFHATFHMLSFPFLELLVFLLITPFVQRKTEGTKSIYNGCCI
ncbi:GerAB/ArcD/ProY family transporter [Anaerobacillus sp. HL2]|nr:GerAB/ArcD/ProY family transporter [Anaerobacillus sp. HL2]